jgi:hypothetical protein
MAESSGDSLKQRSQSVSVVAAARPQNTAAAKARHFTLGRNQVRNQELTLRQV